MNLAGTVSQAVAKRYAIALISLAEENKKLPKIEKDLVSLAEVIRESADLSQTIKNQSVSRVQKESVLIDLASKMKLQKETQNFLGVIARNGRASGLLAIINAAEKELADRRGEMTADVITATALTQAQAKALSKELSGATGKIVSVNAMIDETIMGGMIVTVGSRRVDASVAGRLDRLKETMRARVDISTNDNVEKLNDKKEA